MDDSRRNNDGLVQRLFDQLEKALDKVDDGMSNLGQAISEMLDVLKHNTTNEDVIDEIKEHSQRVTPTIEVAKSILIKCNDHGTHINSINKNIETLTGWVKKMILVITIAFSLMTVTYFITKNSINTMVKSEISKNDKIENDDTTLLLQKIDMLQRKINEEILRSTKADAYYKTITK